MGNIKNGKFVYKNEDSMKKMHEFYDKGLIKYVGVMLKGKMEVLTDQETKNMIWRKGDTMFYKGGAS